ncbi:MAG: hypothetical protein VB050_10300 [Geobacteraceae bacterium]|nr:hypothetical protein [Geobacteraceae bacterium]
MKDIMETIKADASLGKLANATITGGAGHSFQHIGTYFILRKESNS